MNSKKITLKASGKSAAENILKQLFHFSDQITFDISCKSSARLMTHEMQAWVSQNNKKP